MVLLRVRSKKSEVFGGVLEEGEVFELSQLVYDVLPSFSFLPLFFYGGFDLGQAFPFDESGSLFQ